MTTLACAPTSPTPSDISHRKPKTEGDRPMPDDSGGNGWEEYRKLVVKEIERLSKAQEETNKLIRETEHDRAADYERLRDDFSRLCAEVAVNKAKIAMIGAISGLVAGGVMSIITSIVVLFLQKGGP